MVDFDVALLVVAVPLPAVFLAAPAALLAVVVTATFPLGLAVPVPFVALLTPLVVPELFLIAADVIVFALVLVVSVMVVVLGGAGEVDDSTFTRFTAGPFCGKDIT